MGIFDWLAGNQQTATSEKTDSFETLITKYSKQGAISGNASSQLNYGIACLKGKHFPKDIEAGIDWLIKAANQNNVSAMISLGNIYAKGLYGINQNFSEAINWYFMVASRDPEILDNFDSGNRVRAITNLGLIYARGFGDTKYSKHVVKLLSGSGLENTNNIPYMYCLGLIFSNGLAGYEINHDIASTFYLTMIRKDIENSIKLSPDPERRILLEYSDVDDNHLDFDIPTNYLEKIAALGSAKAQFALAIAYWNGWRNVPINKNIAVKFLEQASAQGDELAITMLSEISPINSNITSDTIQDNHLELSNDESKVANDSGVVNYSFRLEEETDLSPRLFGLHIVKLSLTKSSKVIDEIIGTNDNNIQKAISENRGPVQLHLLVLQLAAYYNCAHILSSSNRGVLDEVIAGISEGITAIIGEFNSNIYELFKDYIRSLSNELKNKNNDSFSNQGETANLVASNISSQCNINNLITQNQFERIRIEAAVSRIGIKLLSGLLKNKKMEFINHMNKS